MPIKDKKGYNKRYYQEHSEEILAKKRAEREKIKYILVDEAGTEYFVCCKRHKKDLAAKGKKMAQTNKDVSEKMGRTLPVKFKLVKTQKREACYFCDYESFTKRI